MLEVRDITFGYASEPALSEVDLTVRAGEFKVLLGPNGAGKTTLFALVTRLFDSPHGTVRIAGADLRREPARALEHVGVVFQQPTLDLDLSVEQNLRYHAALHGMSRRETSRRIDIELERMEMGRRRAEKVRRLNGGHRRRVEVARALLHAPELLLLDEPTVGLDVPTRRGIVEHVHALASDEGIAVLWATHLIDEVRDGDGLAVLHRGTVRAEGRAADLVASEGARDVADLFDRLTAPSAR